MHIVRYEATRVGMEVHDKYGVTNEDGTRALRICADDYTDSTEISCRVAYRGTGLAFYDGVLGSPIKDAYHPRDSRERDIVVEIAPPIEDLDVRREAVAAYASVLFGLEHSPLALDFTAIPGQVTMRLVPHH